ncbi:PKD domain-containing protein [Mangrovimonas sp. AS39]|uniref:PKD domain-containing protein n=1 Tax=Mangrovimonas futianensis TaxID=2895523 RepID=UPI001E4E5B5C|nr:PKD domain-containing protein [Mangrovimonas futianensis]MCF1191434.1 PKD domain-containing protein [Mangrovimonas futianensis]MCF1195129.1 PKD domain-containing protein [Mangrovimonas futianensis]MCF1421194.1 PKD domain-containing protein [Mangrovimonas futianensis]
MKKLISITLLVFFGLLTSCSKDDVNDSLDCFGEALVTHIHHHTDSTNSHIINFDVEYNGDRTISSVKWNFGDGSTGTGNEVSHTYATTGTYEVKVSITVTEGGKSCSFVPIKSVTIN